MHFSYHTHTCTCTLIDCSLMMEKREESAVEHVTECVKMTEKAIAEKEQVVNTCIDGIEIILILYM